MSFFFFFFFFFFENNQIFILEINESITAEIYLFASYNMNTREPLYRTAQSSRGGCSRRVHKIVYVAVKKGTI